MSLFDNDNHHDDNDERKTLPPKIMWASFLNSAGLSFQTGNVTCNIIGYTQLTGMKSVDDTGGFRTTSGDLNVPFENRSLQPESSAASAALPINCTGDKHNSRKQSPGTTTGNNNNGSCSVFYSDNSNQPKRAQWRQVWANCLDYESRDSGLQSSAITSSGLHLDSFSPVSEEESEDFHRKYGMYDKFLQGLGIASTNNSHQGKRKEHERQPQSPRKEHEERKRRKTSSIPSMEYSVSHQAQVSAAVTTGNPLSIPISFSGHPHLDLALLRNMHRRKDR